MAEEKVRRRDIVSGWLNERYWKLSVGEWISLALVFIGLLLIIGFFFIRRETLEINLKHGFAVSDPEFFGSALSMAHPLPISGNRIDLLQNGDEYFPAMLEAIRAAKKTINFEAYIFSSDTVGHQFRDALCERARAGIEVRVLLDGIGSSWTLDNADVEMMKEAGCKFAYYHPLGSWRVDRANRRSHRRVMVVDGRVAFTGGAAFNDKWTGNAQDGEHWRETHIRMQGPIVSVMQVAFQGHWVTSYGEALAGAGQFPALGAAGDLQAQVIISQSFSVAPVPMVQAVSFTAATKRIWITNPYVTPTDDQVRTLVGAVQRGVDVRILLPGPHNDQPWTQSAGRAAYGELLEGGVKILEYQPTMIHSKTMVVDGLFSMIGSSNLDARSSEINEELDVVVYDANFGRQMEEVFLKDQAQSREYTLQEFRSRSWWERVWEYVVAPFKPQL